jgi:hypothetical protein
VEVDVNVEDFPHLAIEGRLLAAAGLNGGQ